MCLLTFVVLPASPRWSLKGVSQTRVTEARGWVFTDLRFLTVTAHGLRSQSSRPCSSGPAGGQGWGGVRWSGREALPAPPPRPVGFLPALLPAQPVFLPLETDSLQKG